MIALLALLGCPAEMLRVELPRGGPDALSMEDLKRDVWELSQLQAPRGQGSPPTAKALDHVQMRFEQMHLLPAFGESYRRRVGEQTLVCGQKDGRSGKALVVAGLDGGAGAAASHGTAAAAISLAKTWDLNSVPEHTLIFCWWPAAGLDDYASTPAAPLDATIAIVTLGPLDGDEVMATESSLGELPVLHLSTGDRPHHGTAEDTIDALDYVAMRELLVGVRARIAELL